MFKCRRVLWVLLILTIMAPVQVFGSDPAEESKYSGDVSEDTPLEAVDEPGPESTDGKKTKKAKDPNRGRFLPIPIFITEPAIGEGFGLALTYFHRQKDVPDERSLASMHSISDASKEQAPPPTITGVFGAYTSNDTKAGGIGHMNTFKDDHIRYTGVAALADVNSTFYLLDQPFKFNLRGTMVYQEVRFRIGDSKWFWGLGMSYLDASSAFRVDLPEDIPLDLFRKDLKNNGLAVKVAWDTRDNTALPSNGQLFDLALWRYDETVGGDYDYWNAKLKLISFHKLSEKFVLGARLEVSAIDGSAPFFAIPWVTLRGIPALRYQGDRVGVFEVEGRYNLAPRWAVLGFAGAGSVSSQKPAIDTDQSIYSYGLGARYKIFDEQNVWVGIDIAKGPEEFNWYIQVGHAW